MVEETGEDYRVGFHAPTGSEINLVAPFALVSLVSPTGRRLKDIQGAERKKCVFPQEREGQENL